LTVVGCSAVSTPDEQEPSQLSYQDAVTSTQPLYSADPADWQRLVYVCFMTLPYRVVSQV